MGDEVTKQIDYNVEMDGRMIGTAPEDEFSSAEEMEDAFEVILRDEWEPKGDDAHEDEFLHIDVNVDVSEHDDETEA